MGYTSFPVAVAAFIFASRTPPLVDWRDEFDVPNALRKAHGKTNQTNVAFFYAGE